MNGITHSPVNQSRVTDVTEDKWRNNMRMKSRRGAKRLRPTTAYSAAIRQPFLIVLVALCTPPLSAAAQGTNTSHEQNYKQIVSLPRDGEKTANTGVDLDKIVARHNRTLTENPAKRNRNRIVRMTPPDQYEPVKFPIEHGAVLFDGAGKAIGSLDDSVHSVQINFGQRKRIGSADYLYAFSTRVKDVGQLSGWIPESALSQSTESRENAALLKMDVHNQPDGGDAPERYRVVGDTAAHWAFDRLKVDPKIDGRTNKHVCASDYVTRPGNIVYLLYSLPRHGGVATDSISIGAEFIPAAGVPRVLLPLYLPTDAMSAEQQAWDGKSLPHEMEFVYGRVGDRYGWIAATDIKQSGP
jgi:hypothetical protein